MLSRKKIFYVYALLDPRKAGPFKYGRWKFDFEPFYIGKGKGRRASSHLRHASTSHKGNKIKRIFESGLVPIVVIKKRNLTEHQAFCLEATFIALIGRKGNGPLTNSTSGGEGCSNPSEETRKLLREASAQQWDNFSDREKKHIKNKISENTISGLSVRSDSKKAKHRKKLSVASKAFWATLSPEERKSRLMEVVLKRESGLSDDDRDKRKVRLSKHMLEVVNARESNPRQKKKHYAKVSKALCKSVSIDGIIYESSRAASKALGLCPASICKRLNSANFSTYFRI